MGKHGSRRLALPDSNLDGKGDIECSGHAWTKHGNLFVAGGSRYVTVQEPPGGYDHEGSKLVYIWDPRKWQNTALARGWVPQRDLAQYRWYPTVTVLGLGASPAQDDKLMVSGGAIQHHPVPNIPSTYEVAKLTLQGLTIQWDQHSPGNRIYDGPAPATPEQQEGGDPFHLYPRIHLLTSGYTFYSGFFKDNGKLKHVPTSKTPIFDYLVGQWNPAGVEVTLNTSVLFPIDLDPRSIEQTS